MKWWTPVRVKPAGCARQSTGIVSFFFIMNIKQVLIHCQPEMLPLIKELDLAWSESPQFGEDEIDVLVFDNQDLDDEELVEAVGLNFNQVNCIELADDESCISLA